MVDPPFTPTAAEQRLLEAIAANGRDDGAPHAPVDPHRKDGWKERTVRAELLAALLSAPTDGAPGHDVHLHDWRIEGDLDLTRVRLQRPLRLTSCRLTGSLVARGATVPELELSDGVVLGGVEAKALAIDGSLVLCRSSFRRAVRLDDARVGDDLDCRDVTIGGDGAVALSARGIEVDGDVMLDDMTTTSGGVSLAYARVGRDLDCTAASFRTGRDDALALVGARVSGDVDCSGTRLVTHDRGGDALDASALTARFLRLSLLTYQSGVDYRRFEAVGSVRLEAVELARLSCAGASIRRPDGLALLLNSAKIADDVLLICCALPGEQGTARFELEGGLQIADTQIGADLRMEGARLAHPHGNALDAPGLRARSVQLTLGPNGVEQRSDRFEADGTVWLGGCEIGTLDCEGARLNGAGDDGDALVVSDGTITGSIRLSVDWGAEDLEQARFDANGAVDLSGTRVSGDVWLDGARLRGQLRATGLKARAVTMDAAISGQAVVPFETHAAVLLENAEIGSLSCQGAVLDGAEDDALSLYGTVVQGDVNLISFFHEHVPYRFQARGTIDASYARVAGDVNLHGAKLEGGDGDALWAEGLRARHVSLDPLFDDGAVGLRFESVGLVDLRQAELDGLSATGARLDGGGGDALVARGARIAGKAWLGLAFAPEEGPARDARGRLLRLEAHGTIDLARATIGHLEMHGARLERPGGVALELTSATVNGALELGAPCDEAGDPVLDRDRPVRFTARGIVSLTHATVDRLACGGAWIAGTPRRAFDARGLTARSDVALGLPVRPDGGVMHGPDGQPVGLAVRGPTSLRGARIAGALDCRGATFLAPRGTAFNASGAHVEGTLTWHHVQCTGEVDFRQASVGALYDDCDSWLSAGCEPLRLEAFVYRAVQSTDGAQREWTWRRSWLARQKHFASQPYQQLAGTYRAAGDDHAARKIAMARFNVQLTRRRLFVAPRETLWRTLLRIVIGHGYEPWRALPVLVVLWAAGWLAVDAAVDAHAVAPRAPRAPVVARADPTDCDQRRYPCLEPSLLAADLLVPVINLGQRDAWRMAGDLRYRMIPVLLTAMGWILTTLVVAGFTGLVRRE